MNKNIVFIGLPGCGKTTIGEIIAERLDVNYCDIDQYIEIREGKTIPEIFEHGEAHFREIESKAVEEVSKHSSIVISTGGGVVTIPDNMKILMKDNIVIFINRPVEHIASDVNIANRPLLKDGKEKIYKLNKERFHLYKKYSHHEIINDTDLDIVINRILQYINDMMKENKITLLEKYKYTNENRKKFYRALASYNVKP